LLAVNQPGKMDVEGRCVRGSDALVFKCVVDWAWYIMWDRERCSLDMIVGGRVDGTGNGSGQERKKAELAGRKASSELAHLAGPVQSVAPMEDLG